MRGPAPLNKLTQPPHDTGRDPLFRGCVVEDGCSIAWRRPARRARRPRRDRPRRARGTTVSARMLAAGVPRARARPGARRPATRSTPPTSCRTSTGATWSRPCATATTRPRGVNPPPELSRERPGNATMHQNSIRTTQWRRVAMVGAGPSGFYATAQLLDAGSGQPDQPAPRIQARPRAAWPRSHRKSSCKAEIWRPARREGFRFFGRMELRTTSPARVRERYHAVPLRGRTSTTTVSESGGPSHSSPATRRHRMWYNGHPHASNETFQPFRGARRRRRQRQRGVDVARPCSSSTPTSWRLQPTPPTTRWSLQRGRRARGQCSSAAEARPGRVHESRAPRARRADPRRRRRRPVNLDLDADSLHWLEAEGDADGERNVTSCAPHQQPHTHKPRFLRSPSRSSRGEDSRSPASASPAAGSSARRRTAASAPSPTGEEEVVDTASCCARSAPRPAARRPPLRRAPRPHP